MIDWTRVIELRDEIGAEDFEEVVVLFLSEVEERLEILGAEKPAAALCDDLHFLKGSALNLGFSDFAELCHQGEASISKGGMIETTDMIHSTYTQSKAFFLDNLSTRALA